MRKKLQQLHNEAAHKRFTTFIALLVVLLFANGEEESRIDRFAHGIYSLNGQLISNSSSLDGLPSGIYILNGKKVIKR